MGTDGISSAFMKYGAKLKNNQWSVSAWAPDGSLVVSLWSHHYRKGPPGTMEFSGSANRWGGHGNEEFRENVAKAYEEKSNVRLVIVRTKEEARVESGEDASKIKKTFAVRDDVIGKVLFFDGTNYVFRFIKSA